MMSSARALVVFLTALAVLSASAFVVPSSSSLVSRGRAVSGTRLAMSAQAPAVQKGLVTIYHKETCPHCKAVVALLSGDYELELNMVNVLGEDSEKKIKQMRTFSGGRNTVPQVFFNSEHLGGNDDVQTLHKEGSLSSLVQKVREEEPSLMKDSWYHPWY